MADFNANGSGRPARESFDKYASFVDAASGPTPKWRASSGWFLATGRFAGSRALASGTDNATLLDMGSTGSNDGAALLRFALEQTSALSGANLGLGLQLLDGTTEQCSVMFRSDGSVVLTSGGAGGTALAILTGVFTQATWWQMQIEVVVHNTAGSIKIWKASQTGDPATVPPDHSATGLNTRGGTAHNYANNIRVVTGAGMSSIGGGNQLLDDFHAHNEVNAGVTAGPYNLVGDLRSSEQPAASDVLVQFARAGTPPALPSGSPAIGLSPASGITYGTAGKFIWVPFIHSAGTGTLDHIDMVSPANAPSTVSQAALYGDAITTNRPGPLLAVCNAPVTGIVGGATYSFAGQNIPIVPGVRYWACFVLDRPTANFYGWVYNGFSLYYSGDCSALTTNILNGVYASFPPSGSGAGFSAVVSEGEFNPTVACGAVLSAPNTNYGCVNEPQEDGAISYVFDATVGQLDQYGIQTLTSTPVYIDAVETYAYEWKSDAGARSGQVELRSGAATDDSPSTPLTTTGGYLGKCYTADPNTGSQWTPTGVNNLTVGPKVSA